MVALALAAAAPLPICAHTPTQAAMTACAGKRYEQADALLNAQFRRTYNALHGRAKLLLAAQRAWITFRDAECDAETAGSIGGTIHPMDVAACRTRLTTDRTHTLADLAKGR